MDLYQQGVLPLIIQLLGHKSADTTSAFYAFRDPRRLMRKAVDGATPAPTLKGQQTGPEQRLRQLHTLK